MNALQRYNHTILRKHIFSPRILCSLNILPNGVIELHDMEWQDYWGENCLQSLLGKLFLSWHEWISTRFDQSKLNRYVYDYFRLLETALVAYQVGQIDYCFLEKIVAFETFCVTTPVSNSNVSSLFSMRNPNYLLHKIPNRIACDDPKYLPVICRRDQLGSSARLYFHYRRIPIKCSQGTQLFVYPAVPSSVRECSGFDVIDLLFRVLTKKNDPWIKTRCASLAKSVFNDLIISLNKPKINLLDLGCGSAKLSMQLCTQAHHCTQSSFDVSLIDSIPSRFSIAHSFYRNSQSFEAIRYRRNNLFEWLSDMHHCQVTFDITLMLRVFDTLCQYQAESISFENVRHSLQLQDYSAVLHSPTSQQILNSPDKIVHSLHRIQTQFGMAFFQPALQDYFKAVFLCCNKNSIQSDKEMILPVRSFSEKLLVMEDGISIIERIMEKSKYLVIEDSDVTLELLRYHAEKRRLNHLMFANKKSRQYFQNSHFILISHISH